MTKLLGYKKTVAFVFILGFMFVLSFMVGEAQSKSYKWKISQGIAEDHPAAARSKQFAKIVGEKSGGRIKLTYFPSGALGDWMEQIEANRMGTLEVGLNAGSTSYDHQFISGKHYPSLCTHALSGRFDRRQCTAKRICKTGLILYDFRSAARYLGSHLCPRICVGFG